MEYFEISEIVELTKLSAYTLRYYEKIGLIKDIKRNSSGKRIYSEEDLRWLEFINRLRATGMSISKMKEYADLRNIGEGTIKERKNILQQHLNAIEKEIEKLLEVKVYVEKKIDIYNEMEEKINGK